VLDDIGVLADAANEQWRRLDDRHAQMAITVTLEHRPCDILEALPQRRLVGQDVVHAANGLQCCCHRAPS